MQRAMAMKVRNGLKGRGIRFACLLLFMSAMVLPAPSPVGAIHGQNWQRADESLQAILRWAVRDHLLGMDGVGISVAIGAGDAVVFEYAFGFSDLEQSALARPDTVYRLASVSKPITAVAVMQLVEKGLIDLDADYRTYVPEFPEKAYVFTTRQILSHTAGIRHYRGDEFQNKKPYKSVEESLNIFKDDPLIARPGERYSYSTYGYNLLAYLIEKQTGLSFPEYLEKYIFGALGLSRSGVEDLQKIVLRRARGYVRNSQGNLLNSEFADVSNKWAGGGMVSTASELCRFGLALVNGRLLSPRTLEIMWTPQRLRNGQWTNYGLGWGIGEFLGRRIVYHGGAQQGTRTYLLVFPEEHVVITVLSNYENDQPSRLARRLAEIWFSQGEKSGVVVAERKPVASRTTKAPSPTGSSKQPARAGKKDAPK